MDSSQKDSDVGQLETKWVLDGLLSAAAVAAVALGLKHDAGSAPLVLMVPSRLGTGGALRGAGALEGADVLEGALGDALALELLATLAVARALDESGGPGAAAEAVPGK